MNDNSVSNQLPKGTSGLNAQEVVDRFLADAHGMDFSTFLSEVARVVRRLAPPRSEQRRYWQEQLRIFGRPTREALVLWRKNSRRSQQDRRYRSDSGKAPAPGLVWQNDFIQKSFGKRKPKGAWIDAELAHAIAKGLMNSPFDLLEAHLVEETYRHLIHDNKKDFPIGGSFALLTFIHDWHANRVSERLGPGAWGLRLCREGQAFCEEWIVSEKHLAVEPRRRRQFILAQVESIFQMLPSESSQQPKLRPGSALPAECDEQSPRCAPMTRTEIARRLLNRATARVRDAKGMMEQHGLRKEHGNFFTIEVDKLDPETRKRLLKTVS